MKNIKKIEKKSALKTADKKIRTELKKSGKKANMACPELHA